MKIDSQKRRTQHPTDVKIEKKKGAELIMNMKAPREWSPQGIAILQNKLERLNRPHVHPHVDASGEKACPDQRNRPDEIHIRDIP